MKKIRFFSMIYTGMIFLAFLLGSCKKEIDFEGDLPANKLVLNCFVDADSLIAASMSKSWNLSQEKGESMRSAEVFLYINDVFQEIMQPTDDPLNSLPLFDGETGIVPTIYYTHVSHSKAKEGDVVKIIAKKSGYETISAQTQLPGKTSILSVDTVRFSAQYNPNSMRFLIKFKDLEAGKKNYYRLVIERMTSTDQIHWENNSSTVFFDYDQDPALREGFVNVTDEMLATEIENIYGIFNDEIFDGKEYTLNISFSPTYSYAAEDYRGGRPGLYTRYQFKLVTLSESAYLYLKSRTFYDYNGNDDVFAEPGIIFSNITNGLGIMGSFQTDTATIEMPVMEDYYYY